MSKEILERGGKVFGVAVDQGSGLGKAIKDLRGAQAKDSDLLDFKRIVVETLSPDASTVLVDAHYGRELLPHYDAQCMKMLAYEADVYKISDEDRITALPDNLTVSDYPALDTGILKFFLYYGPNDAAELNERKLALVGDIGKQCKRAGITFLFEPIVYDRSIPDSTSEAYAKLKPDLVTAATKAFADPRLGVDILKVEIPVNFNFVEGTGTSVLSKADAEQAFVTAAEAAGDIPLLYLSAGVTFDQFRDALAFSRKAGVNALGFMCGRGIWSDAIGIFGVDGPAAMERWMKTTGRDRLAELKDAIA